MPGTASVPVTKLLSGHAMPMVGLGTWRAKPNVAKTVVLEAFKAGYRHFDCAYVYENEGEIGEAFKTFPRQDIFVTSKLWNTFHHPGDVKKACLESIEKLQVGYLDLYLIHWPVAFVDDGEGKGNSKRDANNKPFLDTTVTLTDTWHAMEALVDEGLVKSIGISNFNVAQTEEILKAARIPPAVNQVEIHPFHPQDELVSFCQSKGIVMTAYSPFGAGMEPNLLEDPALKAIAQDVQLPVSTLVLSWLVQRGIVVIPKTSNVERLATNLVTVPLDGSVMSRIAQVPTRKRYVDPREGWGVTLF